MLQYYFQFIIMMSTKNIYLIFLCIVYDFYLSLQLQKSTVASFRVRTETQLHFV